MIKNKNQRQELSKPKPAAALPPAVQPAPAQQAAPAQMSECCATCEYRMADGCCHAGPPALQYPYMNPRKLWPEVPADEWCGQYVRIRRTT